MPNDTSFLTSEVADGREAWQRDHDAAMTCREVEDLIQLGLGLFHMIRLGDHLWSKKVQSGASQFDPARAQHIHNEYVRWLNPTEDLLGLIGDMEKKLFEVDNADQFRNAVRLARKLALVDVEDLIESVAQADAGLAEPLTDEVWGEVSGQANA
jgi:hypothetical protein